MTDISRLYHRLRAYVLRDIRQALAGQTPLGGLSASAGAGHTHDDRYYTETEADSRYVEAAGDHVTGNITAASGVTFDGVDLDLHAADANAHHNQQHALDGSDHTGTLSWSKVDKAGASLADLPTRNHTDLQAVGANDHHSQVHGLVSSDHTASGLTVGHVLQAVSLTGFNFAALSHTDLTDVGEDQHHTAFIGLKGDAGTAVPPDIGNYIHVLGGEGIASTEDAVNNTLSLAVDSSVVRTSRQVLAGNGLTGGGSLSADVTLNVGAGAGITVNADDVALTTPGTLSVSSTNTASGNHTHAVTSSSDPQATASLLASDSNGRLTLQQLRIRDRMEPVSTTSPAMRLRGLSGQATDLWSVEDSTGQPLIAVASDGALESRNPSFVSGLTGWQIAPNGKAEFNDIIARGSFHASVFVADEMHATGGTMAVMTSSRIRPATPPHQNTIPGDPGETIDVGMWFGGTLSTYGAGYDADRTEMIVESSWSVQASPFQQNDILRIKALMQNGSTLEIIDTYWLVVGAPTYNGDRDMTSGSAGTYTVPVELKYPIPAPTGAKIPSGAAIVKWGEVGSTAKGGMILTSDLSYSPYIDIFTVDPSGTSWPPAVTPHVRVGNLDGVLGLTEQWGLAAGADLSDTTQPYAILSNQQFKLYGVNVDFSSVGNLTVGSTFQVDSNGLRVGDFASVPPSYGYLHLNTTGHLLGYKAEAGVSSQWLDLDPEDGIIVQDSGGNDVGVLEQSGNLFIGSGFSRPHATNADLQGTTLAVFAVDTSFGVGTMGAGDAVLGDYTAAHLWWDASAGRLNFRNGSTTKLYLDTDGSLKAGGGDVMMDTDGITLTAGTYTTNRLTWKSGTTGISELYGYSDTPNLTETTMLTAVGNGTNPYGRVALQAWHNGSNSSDMSYLWITSGSASSSAGEIYANTNGNIVLLADRVRMYAPLNLQPQATPSGLVADTDANVYVRNNKLIVQYNDGGTTRYKYLPLSGTSVTWVHTTTAP